MDEGRLAIISSAYGKIHLFAVEDEDLAHCIYRWIIEDLYDNEEARSSEDFGFGFVGRQNEEYEGSRDPEGESGPGLPY